MLVALLGNDIFQYGVVIVLLLLIGVWRFIGLKKAGRWLFLRNTPEKRKAKAAAQKEADASTEKADAERAG